MEPLALTLDGTNFATVTDLMNFPAFRERLQEIRTRILGLPFLVGAV